MREKYIRQKHRQTYGDVPKWQFMTDMAFLDCVIQYRKNKWIGSQSMDSESTAEAQINITDSEADEHTSDSYRQPNNFNYNFQNNIEEIQHLQSKSTPDSTLTVEPKRQRTNSDSTDISIKKEYIEETPNKTPEQIFGEFVAAILSTKSVNERNRIMMKIMSVLTESTN